MATQSVIDDLTTVIQTCLEEKLKAGFDANAALTIDIAREVATNVENKCNTYTDVEITKLVDLIGGGEVDLGPFTEFMNTIKTLLDGDENTEGYQIFNTLITDTATNKQTLIDHSTSIQLITNQLNTFQTTLVDHESRIAALEALDYGDPIDCEECHDDILEIIKDAQAQACTAASDSIAAYQAAETDSIVSDFANEMDPISLFNMTSEVSDTNIITISGEYTGRRIANITVSLPSGTADVTMTPTVNSISGTFTITDTVPTVAGDGAAVVNAYSANPVVKLNDFDTVSYSVPGAVEGDGGEGEGDGAVL